MIRGLPVLLLAAGCFSIPPYEPPNAVTYTADPDGGGGGRVAGDGFELHFASGPGFHFPDSLKVGGVEMIGDDIDRYCYEESGIGIRLEPTPRIAADSSPNKVVTNVLTPVIGGPIVVKVKLDWSTSFKCSDETRPAGTSTFTVFPDARIVRYDEIFDPSAEVSAASSCACDATASYFTVATYWTIARGGFRSLYIPDTPDINPPPQNNVVISGQTQACVDDGTHRLTFAWPSNQNTTIGGTEKLVSFGREFWLKMPTLPGDLRYENSSALFIGTAGCKDEGGGFDRAEEFRTASSIMVGDTAASFSVKDGIFGSEQPDGPGVMVAGRTEIKGTVNSSFAVWLRFSRSVEVVRARRMNAMGRWYLPQRVDARSWIVWFRDPLVLTQPITIEPG